MIEVSFIILSIFLQWCPPLTPRRGRGGQMEVKSQFCSNFHQIWWKEAFLQVIQGSLSKTLILIRFFCIFHLSPSICLKFYYKRPLNLIFDWWIMLLVGYMSSLIAPFCSFLPVWNQAPSQTVILDCIFCKFHSSAPICLKIISKKTTKLGVFTNETWILVRKHRSPILSSPGHLGSKFQFLINYSTFLWVWG